MNEAKKRKRNEWSDVGSGIKISYTAFLCCMHREASHQLKRGFALIRWLKTLRPKAANQERKDRATISLCQTGPCCLKPCYFLKCNPKTSPVLPQLQNLVSPLAEWEK